MRLFARVAPAAWSGKQAVTRPNGALELGRAKA
jgi:hypothetical protein